MGCVDPPTVDDLLPLAHDREAWDAALDRWGFDAIAYPDWNAQPCRRGLGLGDLVKALTNLLGLRTCCACEQRRRRWNRWQLGWRRRG